MAKKTIAWFPVKTVQLSGHVFMNWKRIGLFSATVTALKNMIYRKSGMSAGMVIVGITKMVVRYWRDMKNGKKNRTSNHKWWKADIYTTKINIRKVFKSSKDEIPSLHCRVRGFYKFRAFSLFLKFYPNRLKPVILCNSTVSTVWRSHYPYHPPR